MTAKLAIGTLLATLILLAPLSLVGCSQPVPPGPLPSPRLQQVARLYLWYAAKHGAAGPADRATLAAYLQSLDPTTQKTLRIDTTNSDELLTSPRDHGAYHISYGLSLKTAYRESPVLAYEQSATDGTRQVVFLNGQFQEVSETELTKLLRRR